MKILLKFSFFLKKKKETIFANGILNRTPCALEENLYSLVYSYLHPNYSPIILWTFLYFIGWLDLLYRAVASLGDSEILLLRFLLRKLNKFVYLQNQTFRWLFFRLSFVLSVGWIFYIEQLLPSMILKTYCYVSYFENWINLSIFKITCGT